MRAINHAVTGALIGLIVTRPVLALPLAVASHFVCDVIPHYDPDLTHSSIREWIHSKKFRYLLYADAFLCFCVVLVLAIRHPAHWELSAICAFLATSPDLFSIPLYLRLGPDKKWRLDAYTRFNLATQWFRRPIGAVVEIAWFAGACVLLSAVPR